MRSVSPQVRALLPGLVIEPLRGPLNFVGCSRVGALTSFQALSHPPCSDLNARSALPLLVGGRLSVKITWAICGWYLRPVVASAAWEQPCRPAAGGGLGCRAWHVPCRRREGLIFCGGASGTWGSLPECGALVECWHRSTLLWEIVFLNTPTYKFNWCTCAGARSRPGLPLALLPQTPLFFSCFVWDKCF